MSKQPSRRARRTDAVVDFQALVTYLSRMPEELEQAWVAALDVGRLAEIDAQLTREWQALVTVVQLGGNTSDTELSELGLDSTVPADPLPLEDVADLATAPDLQEQRRQLQQAQLTAFELVMSAVQHARRIGPRPHDRITGEAGESWFESGAFALLRARVHLLGRVTDLLERAETLLVRQAHGEESEREARLEVPPFLTHRRLAADALARGDVEASLLHASVATRCFIAALAAIEPAEVADLASWLGESPEARVVGKLEELGESLAVGMREEIGAGLLVARAMIVVLDRLIASPPVEAIEKRRDATRLGGT